MVLVLRHSIGNCSIIISSGSGGGHGPGPGSGSSNSNWAK